MSGKGSTFAPNLIAAICACLGDGEVNGVLPVKLPALNDNYRPVDTAEESGTP